MWLSFADSTEPGGQPAEGEEARLKVERLRITRMRAQLETALARLQHEKAAFDTHKVRITERCAASCTCDTAALRCCDCYAAPKPSSLLIGTLRFLQPKRTGVSNTRGT